MTKKTGITSIVCLVFTILWIILMIAFIAGARELKTLEDAVYLASSRGTLYYLSFINAVCVTVAATVFFAYLYQDIKKHYSGAALAGMAFIPVYCAINLFVYSSQITIVPILASHADSQYSDIYKVILGQFVQGWPGSTVWVLNQLGYAVLGIPSIVFGVLLIKHIAGAKPGGVLLSLNGAACIAGVAGIVFKNTLLMMGSVVGGVLFLFALIAIAVAAFRQRVTGEGLSVDFSTRLE
ncbi:MAG: hypothetical protein N3I35_05335 [Clostridia bacterium]|nr:hypothetical protein [Clostridia bacterium]